MEDNFINNIKKNYKEPDIDIDVDQLWDNIDQEIDEKKRRPFIIPLWGGLCIVVLAMIFFYTNSTNQFENDELAIAELQKQEITTSTNNNNETINYSIDKNTIDNNSIDEVDNKESKKVNTNSQSNQSSVNKTKTLTQNKASQSNDNYTSISKVKEGSMLSSSVHTLTSQFADLQNNNQHSLLKQHIQLAQNTSFNTIVEHSSLPTLSLIAFQKISIDEDKVELPSTFYFKPTQKKANTKIQNRFSLEILMGASLFSESLESKSLNQEQFVNEQINHRTSLEAINTMALLSVKLNPSLSIKTGLSLSQFTTKFEYDGTYFEPYNRTELDTIIITGPEPQDFIELSSDQAVMKTINRQTKHFNKYKFYSIPVLFSYSKNTYKISPEFVLGPSFNLRSSVSGMMLNNMLIPTDYISNHYNRKVGIGIHSGINFKYNMGSQTALLLGAQANYIPNLTNANHFYDQTLFSYGLNVGVRIKL